MRAWVTQTGKRIHVKNMSTRHIKNCIKIVRKKDSYSDELLEPIEGCFCAIWTNNELTAEEWLKVFNEELKKRKTEKPTLETFLRDCN